MVQLNPVPVFGAKKIPVLFDGNFPPHAAPLSGLENTLRVDILSRKFMIAPIFSFVECNLQDAAFLTWSALVNIRRKALLSSDGFRERMTSRSPPSLKYVIHLHFDVRSSIRSISYRFLVRGFVPLFRSFLNWFQSIQTRRCHCLRLKGVLTCQASSCKLCSAGKRTFRWMLLNNIPWMAPGMYDVSRWQ